MNELKDMFVSIIQLQSNQFTQSLKPRPVKYNMTINFKLCGNMLKANIYSIQSRPRQIIPTHASYAMLALMLFAAGNISQKTQLQPEDHFVHGNARFIKIYTIYQDTMRETIYNLPLQTVTGCEAIKCSHTLLLSLHLVFFFPTTQNYNFNILGLFEQLIKKKKKRFSCTSL